MGLAGLVYGKEGLWLGKGTTANKVWIELRSLAGSVPRPSGHENLGRNLRPQVGGA